MQEFQDEYAISMVPKESLNRFLPLVRANLEAAVAHASGRVKVEDIFAELRAGKQTLWVVYKDKTLLGSWTSKVYQIPSARICCIEWIGGSGLPEWITPGLETMERYARHTGCKRLEAHGRRGWERTLSKFGWHTYSISLEKDL